MGMVGMGDVTTAPIQGAPSAPPATISPYAAPVCGWGQKTVGNGPFTCQFDIGTTLAQAWEVPGVYVGTMLAKAFPSVANSLNPNLISAAVYGGVAWLIYSSRKGAK